MKNKRELKMHRFGNGISVDVNFWDRIKNIYRPALFLFDTGASINTISAGILQELGYDIHSGKMRTISTASGIENVREVIIDKVQFAGYEFENVLVYAHTFPEEGLASGVLGLNLLSLFDIELIFSKGLIRLTKND